MTRKPIKRASNPHQAVAPAFAAPKKRLIQAANIGMGLKTNPSGMGGMEYVEGYKRRDGARAMGQLRDIGELSFGSPRRIIGTDDRVQVGQTNIYPWSAIVSLFIESPAGNGIGTGFFIGPKTIATCGHCVYIRPQANPSAADWATQITVMPGRNDAVAAPDNLPFGSVVVPRSSLRSVTGWTEDGEYQYDYGAIVLDTELGNRTGWFGFGAYSEDQIKGFTGNLSGYPGDKGGGTQWFHSGGITSVDDRDVYYQIDMMPGHSGSPVWAVLDQGRYAFAINAYEQAGNDNFGTRIGSEVSANLVQWKG